MYQYITVRVTGMLVYPRASAPRWQCIRIQCTSVPGHYCRRRFGVPVNPCPGESVSYYTDIPTYCYTCVPKHRCTHVHDEAMCRVPACQCTGVPLYRRNGVPIYRCTHSLPPPPKKLKKGSQTCLKKHMRSPPRRHQARTPRHFSEVDFAR